MTDITVVGGGLAGLVAARRLAQAGFDVRVFERRSEVGGRVGTHDHKGFTLDRGFQVLFTAYPAVQRELDLDALDLRYFPPGAIIAHPDDRSTLSDPFRDPTAAVATLRNDAIRQTDKLRLLALQFELRRMDAASIFPGPDISIEQYLADRGFSRAFVDRFAAPFYGGITLDRSLSTAAAIFQYTFKMLTEGHIAVPAAGMQAIPEQLADAARNAGACIETDTEVVSLETRGNDSNRGFASGGVTITLESETIDSDAVIVATDPHTARSLTGIESIPTTMRGCVTQYYSFPSSIDFKTHKRLLLNATTAEPNQIAPMSAVAPEYAPPGHQLLSATFLGQPDASETDLVNRTRQALESWYPGLDLTDLLLLDTHRIRFAQFEQPPGIHDRLPDADALGDPVYLAGDYTRWSSIQGALESGRRAATAVRTARQ